jgi:dihydrolipoamide dehydrogenase
MGGVTGSGGLGRDDRKRGKGRRREVGKGICPWAASGHSLSLGRDEGMTKLLFDEATGHVIGCGIVGYGSGRRRW